ncbi:DUF3192 domain-containing protein [Parashewanella curva]|uniref:DUF3192 domain-containing protein n=1 Tax=Parashewanella curva TaxID=2338552 RepID=A0A3L8PTD0_9GAMM|nr:DUF3192 domain-containing protein [Parashewanella curva]RLV57873.1 DUF3192 domain-containing protein [Parashewanella curva]
MKIKLLVAAVLSVSMLSGCVVSIGGDGEHSSYSSSWQKRQKENRMHIGQLQMGMDYQQVINLMGSPDINEAYLENKGESKHEIQVLFYRTQHVSSDSITTKDECTPIVIKNGKVVGWGEKAYQLAKF